MEGRNPQRRRPLRDGRDRSGAEVERNHPSLWHDLPWVVGYDEHVGGPRQEVKERGGLVEVRPLHQVLLDGRWRIPERDLDGAARGAHPGHVGAVVRAILREVSPAQHPRLAERQRREGGRLGPEERVEGAHLGPRRTLEDDEEIVTRSGRVVPDEYARGRREPDRHGIVPPLRVRAGGGEHDERGERVPACSAHRQ